MLPLALAGCFGGSPHTVAGWVNRDNHWPGSEESRAALAACNSGDAVTAEDCMRAKGWRYFESERKLYWGYFW